MIYKTIFDITQIGYEQWRFPAIGLVLTLVVGILVFGPRSFQGLPYFWLPKRVALFLNRVGFVVVVLWTVIILYATLQSYISVRNTLASGNYSTVQGHITDFKPLLQGRTGDESFTVQGKTFSYSDHGLIAGFNKTKREGNQLKEGMEVRVTYINDKILRIEIAEPMKDSISRETEKEEHEIGGAKGSE